MQNTVNWHRDCRHSELGLCQADSAPRSQWSEHRWDYPQRWTLPLPSPTTVHCLGETVSPFTPQRRVLPPPLRRDPLLSHARCRGSLFTPPRLLLAEEAARATARKLLVLPLSLSTRLWKGDFFRRRGGGSAGGRGSPRRFRSPVKKTKWRSWAGTPVRDRRRRGLKSASAEVRRDRFLRFRLRPSTPTSDPDVHASIRRVADLIFCSWGTTVILYTIPTSCVFLWWMKLYTFRFVDNRSEILGPDSTIPTTTHVHRSGVSVRVLFFGVMNHNKLCWFWSAKYGC
jgi:hypothetical protein